MFDHLRITPHPRAARFRIEGSKIQKFLVMAFVTDKMFYPSISVQSLPHPLPRSLPPRIHPTSFFISFCFCAYFSVLFVFVSHSLLDCLLRHDLSLSFHFASHGADVRAAEVECIKKPFFFSRGYGGNTGIQHTKGTKLRLPLRPMSQMHL